MRILLIEDRQTIINVLKKNLEKHCFAVDVAEDGEKGLFMATTDPYDLIILDYGLPKKNGYNVCKEIREDGKTMPILMLTVESDIDTKVELLDIGADDYLTKPYSFRELLSRVNALLRRPNPFKNNVLQIDDLILDARKQTIRRGSKDIYLTRKNFALLEFLMKNQGTVLSKGEILEHVWDNSIDSFSKTIETHILGLRRQIENPRKRKLIHTVQGRGYKIDLL